MANVNAATAPPTSTATKATTTSSSKRPRLSGPEDLDAMKKAKNSTEKAVTDVKPSMVHTTVMPTTTADTAASTTVSPITSTTTTTPIRATTVTKKRTSGSTSSTSSNSTIGDDDDNDVKPASITTTIRNTNVIVAPTVAAAVTPIAKTRKGKEPKTVVETTTAAETSTKIVEDADVGAAAIVVYETKKTDVSWRAFFWICFLLVTNGFTLYAYTQAQMNSDFSVLGAAQGLRTKILEGSQSQLAFLQAQASMWQSKWGQLKAEFDLCQEDLKQLKEQQQLPEQQQEHPEQQEMMNGKIVGGQLN